jgi:hypothetical protein
VKECLRGREEVEESGKAGELVAQRVNEDKGRCFFWNFKETLARFGSGIGIGDGGGSAQVISRFLYSSKVSVVHFQERFSSCVVCYSRCQVCMPSGALVNAGGRRKRNSVPTLG